MDLIVVTIIIPGIIIQKINVVIAESIIIIIVNSGYGIINNGELITIICIRFSMQSLIIILDRLCTHYTNDLLLYA